MMAAWLEEIKNVTFGEAFMEPAVLGEMSSKCENEVPLRCLFCGCFSKCIQNTEGMKVIRLCGHNMATLSCKVLFYSVHFFNVGFRLGKFIHSVIKHK